MNLLTVIVEGETEQAFVRDQLHVHLLLHNTIAIPVLPGRNRNRGGVKNWDVARQDIIRTLKERRYCSTMFDYYALPEDWPGRREAAKRVWNERATHVESMIQADINTAMGGRFDPKYFVPYIQLHEFESLAFADVDILTATLSPITRRTPMQLNASFSSMLHDAGNPEAINDGYDTCPSRRIATVVPAYKKRAQGPIVTSRIGIDKLRVRCSHFGQWLKRLEAIGASGV